MYFLIGALIVAVILAVATNITKRIIKKDGYNVGSDITLTWMIAVIALVFPTGMLITNNPIEYTKQHNETNNKIILYTEENKIIDNEIKSIVESTYAKELKLYSSIKNKSTIELVTIFPNIKSIELVNKQLNIYMSNKTKINKLKEKKIEIESNKIYHQLW